MNDYSSLFKLAVPLTGLLVIQSAISTTAHAQRRSAAHDKIEFFETKIRPVLVESCYECHSSDLDEVAGGLALDTPEGLLKGGVSGPVIIAGRPESSLLLLAIRQDERHLIMPPRDHSDQLSEQVIDVFERWISTGAFDPRRSDGTTTPHGDENNRGWWAWKQARPPTVPLVTDDSWPQSDIDRFVLAKLEANGLTPSQPADRYTLIRRLSLDLTGLPPATDDIEEFARAESPKPIEDLVDKYLSSQQFGERFGRHWLDVARYAESTGKDVNVAYPQAWRYRDYVIDSFNNDKPIDEFIREQIAGDLLPSQSTRQGGERKIATGFLALGPKSVNEMSPAQFAVDVADEQIDALSQAFLGVTIACARCHDHKFDPISQRDYTALAGIFLSTKTHFGTSGGVAGRNRSTLLNLPGEFSVDFEQARTLSPHQIEQLKQRITDLEQQRRDLIRERIAGEATQPDRLKALRLGQQLTRLQVQLDSVNEDGESQPAAMGVQDKPPAPVSQSRLGQNRSRRGNFRNQRTSRQLIKEQVQQAVRARLEMQPYTNRVQQIRSLRYLSDSPQFVRGEIDKPGDLVPRGLPEFLAAGFSGKIEEHESGRLQLAAWISSERNPLTARVFVNRVWSWLLGEGLVSTEDNFGTSGELPSHPELLDYLTIEFIANDWSLKTLVRQIVLSGTYQQASDSRQGAFDQDPENVLLWRANKRPVDAEVLRDSLLSASGKLNLSRPQGSLIARSGDGPIGSRRLGGLSEEAVSQIDSTVRSVYLPVPRGVLPEALELFDFADNSVVDGDRELTIVPSQALYWMNSDYVEEQCRLIAQNLLAQRTPTANENSYSDRRFRRAIRRRWRGRFPGPMPGVSNAPFSLAQTEDLLNELSLSVLSRPALPAEVSAVQAYVEEQGAAGRAMINTWTSITRSLLSSSDFRFVR